MNIYAAADVLASNFRDEKKLINKKVVGKKTKLGAATIRYPSVVKDEDKLQERGIGLIKSPERIPTSIRFGRDTSLEDHSRLERLALIGFQVHNRYWGDKEPFAQSCFDLIVQQLYKKDQVLS